MRSITATWSGYSKVRAVYKVAKANGETNELADLHFLMDPVATLTDFTSADTSF